MRWNSSSQDIRLKRKRQITSVWNHPFGNDRVSNDQGASWYLVRQVPFHEWESNVRSYFFSQCQKLVKEQESVVIQ